MKAIEFQTRVNQDQTLTVPPDVAFLLPKGETVRVLVLLKESDEDTDWRSLTMEQFLEGYAESDAIYDQFPGG
jgi:hypothetical protein